MICPECGNPATTGINFCPRCGASLAGRPAAGEPKSSATVPPAWMPLTGPPPIPPRMPRNSRVESHIQTLGILWCVYAGYRILRGLFALAIVHTVITNFGGWGEGWPGGDFHAAWLTPLLPILGILTVIWSGLAAFTGYSLLTRRPWGRTLAIVVAILTLIKIPVGTALGIYTLWVLGPAASDVEYEAMTQAR